MKRFGKCLIVALISVAMVFGLVPSEGGDVEAASVSFLSYSDLPVNALGEGKAFNASITVNQGTNLTSLQGWLAMKNNTVLQYYWKYTYNGKEFKGNLKWMSRNDPKDVKAVYPGYSSYTGYRLDANSSINISNLPAKARVSLQIYATITPIGTPGRYCDDVLIGTYEVKIEKLAQTVHPVVATAQQEYDLWTRKYYGKPVSIKDERIDVYFQKAAGRGHELGEAWCAGFVSYCLLSNGYGNCLPAPTTEWGRGRLNCEDMRKQFNSLKQYVTNYTPNRTAVLNNVKPGDVVFFMGGAKIPNQTYHVGIVKSVNKSERKITCIDGNAGDYSDILCRDFDLDWSPFGEKSTDYYIIGFGLLHK